MTISVLAVFVAACSGGDPNASGAGRTGVGEGPSSLEEIAWKVVAGREIAAPAAVHDAEIAFVTTHGTVSVIGEDEGEGIWRVERGQPTTAAPAISHGRVVIGDDLGVVARHDSPDGRKVWEVELSGPIEKGVLVDEGVVYVASRDGALTALALDDGRLLWEVRLTAAVTSMPALVDDRVIFGAGDGRVHAVSSLSGEAKWAARCGRGPVTSLAATSSLALASCGERIVGIGADGKVKWEKEHKSVISTGMGIGSGLGVFGTEAGNLVGIDLGSGDERWRFQGDGPFWGAIAIDGKNVFAANHDGSVYAVSTADGKETFRFVAESRPFGGVVAVGGRLYFGDVDGNLYAIE